MEYVLTSSYTKEFILDFTYFKWIFVVNHCLFVTITNYRISLLSFPFLLGSCSRFTPLSLIYLSSLSHYVPVSTHFLLHYKLYLYSSATFFHHHICFHILVSTTSYLFFPFLLGSFCSLETLWLLCRFLQPLYRFLNFSKTERPSSPRGRGLAWVHSIASSVS